MCPSSESVSQQRSFAANKAGPGAVGHCLSSLHVRKTVNLIGGLMLKLKLQYFGHLI